ncbi:tyrosine--tRNA ligase [Ancylobacter defluvii]|uniref:Tyrosine--tRNA ligase n=1 Tax=Ancylobacter defluvii TaxID=1282440 RepID=A0A9W6JWF6_9HYPH|nr:tyrosine--tRNA ligase [Ancylobacter defluvii]MBS7587818.1 tyrosine--tRNA ligase [Ancylobacter defluvii]GLK82628.1 tyrosine--tRNA ligase [Ancylobacter defluvii]
MTTFRSDFLRTLSERGFVHQISDPEGLDTLFATETVTAYIGFDPTAPSLHAGGLIQIMMLHWLQATGHRPVSLMGGGTGMVGDPSFKEEARKLMTVETIEENIASIKQVFSSYLSYGDAPTGAMMINNAEWLRDLNYLEFLRDVGRHFSVNRMLSFDSVKTRLEREQSLSFLEFNYMILQAYDFVELSKRYGVRLQMGGSDQWGNIVNGIDLGHRMGTQQLYALTSPLLTTASGAKMGKSLSGAVWLNADMLSPYEFWQYWRNTEDADVERFLKLYTTLPMDEIARLADEAKGAAINEVKKILATEVTAMLHGRAAAEAAAETARKTFEEGGLSADLPTVEIPAAELEAGIGVLSVFAEKTGLVASNGEARRQIKSGGLKVNDATVTDDKAAVSARDLTPEGVVKLSFGKKKHVLLKPV